MSIWLKRFAYAILIPIVSLIFLVCILRIQAIQYLAAYIGPGFAKALPAAVFGSNSAMVCKSQPINVLTYNVRYGSDFIEAIGKSLNAHDPGGYLPWSQRYPEIQERIKVYDPDLIGLQEMQSDSDIAHIVDLKQYNLLSYHLGAFQYGDSALLFKKDRFDLRDSGQLWLGLNANLPFSLGFTPLAMIRYANWALLREKSSGFTFIFVNTHFDNNLPNKEKSSDLFYKHLSKLTESYPMIVVGDFNSKAVTERYQRLIGSGDAPPRLINAYDLAYSAKTNVTPQPHPKDLIDHILAGGPCIIEADDWYVDKKLLNTGEALSDHDPILAELQFTGKKP